MSASGQTPRRIPTHILDHRGEWIRDPADASIAKSARLWLPDHVRTLTDAEEHVVGWFADDGCVYCSQRGVVMDTLPRNDGYYEWLNRENLLRTIWGMPELQGRELPERPQLCRSCRGTGHVGEP